MAPPVDRVGEFNERRDREYRNPGALPAILIIRSAGDQGHRRAAALRISRFMGFNSCQIWAESVALAAPRIYGSHPVSVKNWELIQLRQMARPRPPKPDCRLRPSIGMKASSLAGPFPRSR